MGGPPHVARVEGLGRQLRVRSCAHLGAAGEQVIEFSHPRTAATSDGAKTDALDARRAAREVLGRHDLAVPRARGRREALRALESTRRGAQTARTAAINELKALIVTWTCATSSAGSPPPPRSPTSQPPNRPCAASHGGSRPSPPRPPTSKRASAGSSAVAPHLLDQPGVGPVTARLVTPRPLPQRSSLRLAGVAPLEASSGQNTRHRLNRRGDRQLNRALHTIAVTRSRYCPHTQAYIAKRTAEGKTPREAQRCLKRYIARQIYRLLQHPKINT